jgi:hypothetical protein
MSTTATFRFIVTTAVGCFATVLVLGCGRSDQAAPDPPAASSTTTVSETPTCDEIVSGSSDLPASYRAEGKELVGDVDGDGRDDRVTLRADEERPARCRYVLVVESAAGDASVAPVAPLPWPGTDPGLLLLAEIDGRSGVEPVIALSPAAVYQPGAVFTMGDGRLTRMRLLGTDVDDLFPLYDEFPAGVDCAAEPGTLVVTLGDLADGGKDDQHWEITRALFSAAGSEFERVRERQLLVEVGPEAGQRWPEVRGDPFRTCGARVD